MSTDDRSRASARARSRASRTAEQQRLIVEAASKLLRAGETPTVRRIAQAADMSVGTIYRYFAGIDEVVAEVRAQWLKDEWSTWEGLRDDVLSDFNLRTWRRLIRSVVAEQIRTAAEHPDFPSIASRQAAIRRTGRETVNFMREVIRVAGSNVDAEGEAAHLIAYGLPAILNRYLEDNAERLDGVDFQNELADMLFYYLTARRE